MDTRTRGIVRTLGVALMANTAAAILKIGYGQFSNSLAFVADGVHSLFDSVSMILGIWTMIVAGQPADEDHPYGHFKFETLSATALGLFLLFAAVEVGSMTYARFMQPEVFPSYNTWALFLLVGVLVMNLALSRYESKRSKELSSRLLASDSLHNASDFWITIGVLISIVSGYLKIPYIDGGISTLITLYLLYLSIKLVLHNVRPLVDHRVLDETKVQEIARSVEGVLDAHQVRSRGESGTYFLDLNIHLPGKMTLEKAHDITHQVEARLKDAFPGLVDVVIYTEPDGHPPCLSSPYRKI